MLVKKPAKGAVVPVSFALTCTVPESFGLRNSQVDLSIHGHMENTEGVCMLNADMSARLESVCGKCLADCDLLAEISLMEGFSEDAEAEKKNLWPIRNELIDIEPAVMTNLFLNIPMRVLCKADCKGLCHICGLNLNDGSCACDKSRIDPRFEVLRELLVDCEDEE